MDVTISYVTKDCQHKYYEVDGITSIPRVGDTVAVPGAPYMSVSNVIWYFNNVGRLASVEVKAV